MFIQDPIAIVLEIGGGVGLWTFLATKYIRKNQKRKIFSLAEDKISEEQKSNHILEIASSPNFRALQKKEEEQKKHMAVMNIPKQQIPAKEKNKYARETEIEREAEKEKLLEAYYGRLGFEESTFCRELVEKMKDLRKCIGSRDEKEYEIILKYIRQRTLWIGERIEFFKNKKSVLSTEETQQIQSAIRRDIEKTLEIINKIHEEEYVNTGSRQEEIDFMLGKSGEPAALKYEYLQEKVPEVINVDKGENSDSGRLERNKLFLDDKFREVHLNIDKAA